MGDMSENKVVKSEEMPLFADKLASFMEIMSAINQSFFWYSTIFVTDPLHNHLLTGWGLYIFP